MKKIRQKEQKWEYLEDDIDYLLFLLYTSN